jgi:hypothetical protein
LQRGGLKEVSGFKIRSFNHAGGFLIKAVLFLSLLLIPIRAFALGVGDPAPDFHITTLDGNEISYYGDVRSREPLYLIFWATW